MVRWDIWDTLFRVYSQTTVIAAIKMTVLWRANASLSQSFTKPLSPDPTPLSKKPTLVLQKTNLRPDTGAM